MAPMNAIFATNEVDPTIVSFSRGQDQGFLHTHYWVMERAMSALMIVSYLQIIAWRKSLSFPFPFAGAAAAAQRGGTRERGRGCWWHGAGGKMKIGGYI